MFIVLVEEIIGYFDFVLIPYIFNCLTFIFKYTLYVKGLFVNYIKDNLTDHCQGNGKNEIDKNGKKLYV